MAEYTTTVRTICESLADPQVLSTLKTVDSTIENAIPSIFPVAFGFLFDEKDAEKKILRHFYMREIAFETPALWQLEINNVLAENKDKYNAIYSVFNDKNLKIFDTDATTEERARKTTDGGNLSAHTSATQSSTNSNTSETVDQYSETPQGGLSDVKSGKYLTTADVKSGTESGQNSGTSSSDSTQETSNSGTEDETVTRSGRSGKSTAELLNANIKDLKTLYQTMFDDLAPCFCFLYN